MAKMKTRFSVSAGGVVLRQGEQGLEVVLANYGQVWGLPKGLQQQGESKEETARREVTEETGLAVEILEPLGDISYWFVAEGARVRKTVHFFLMRATGGDVSQHDYEHERVEWFPLEEAYRVMSYRSEADMVRKAAQQADTYFQ